MNYPNRCYSVTFQLENGRNEFRLLNSRSEAIAFVIGLHLAHEADDSQIAWIKVQKEH